MRRQVFSCDVCGMDKKTANHWFIIQLVNDEFRLSHWNESKAKRKGTIHVCGMEHAHRLMGQYASGGMVTLTRSIEAPVNVCEESVAV